MNRTLIARGLFLASATLIAIPAQAEWSWNPLKGFHKKKAAKVQSQLGAPDATEAQKHFQDAPDMDPLPPPPPPVQMTPAQAAAAAAAAAAPRIKPKGEGKTDDADDSTDDDTPGVSDRNTCPFDPRSAQAAQVFAQQLIIHHIYIGQGDSTFIRTPNVPGTNVPGLAILIDGGESGNQDEIAEILKGCYGINAIDYLVISHPHSDHFGGAVGLMKLTPQVAGAKATFMIKKGVYVNGYGPDNLPGGKAEIVDKDSFGAQIQGSVKLADQINKAIPGNLGPFMPFGKNVAFVSNAGRAEQVTFEVFVASGSVNGKPVNPKVFKTGPNGQPIPGMLRDPNAVSSGIHIKFKTFDYLTMGDITGDNPNIEQDIVDAKAVGKVDIMKASHHGSDTANTDPLLDVVNPFIYVVSAGDAGKNLVSFHLPRAEPIISMHNRVARQSAGGQQGMILMTSCGAGDIMPNNSYCRALQALDIQKEAVKAQTAQAKGGRSFTAFDFQHGGKAGSPGGIIPALTQFKNAQGDIIVVTGGDQYSIVTAHNPNNMNPVIQPAPPRPGNKPANPPILIPRENPTVLGPFPTDKL